MARSDQSSDRSTQQHDLVRSILEASPVDLCGDAVAQRPLFEMVMAPQPIPADLVAAPGRLGDVSATFIEITTVPAPRGIILYLHGGAFALGSASSGVGLAASLARTSGMRAVAIDYRLAPEHPFPAALEDAVAAYRELLRHEALASDGIAIAGDSAGAGLAAAAMVAIGRAGLPQPTSAVLMSPWADLAMRGSSMSTKATVEQVLSAEALRIRAGEYLGAADPLDPLVSPVHADLTGLPPILIQVGSDEILLDDALRLAARAAADEVAVTLEVTPRVPHIFQAFAALLDEGEAALIRAGQHLRSHLPG